MLSQDTLVLETVRSVDTAFSKAITAKDRKKPFDDEEAVKILSTLSKQRQEAADLYTQGDRPDLAIKELAELAIIKTYLPSEMSELAIKASVNNYILDNPQAKMGEIIKTIQQLAVRDGKIVDGKLLSTIVKESLA